MADEYRREMVMLRPLIDDVSGFIRLETRTMRGSARLTATGDPGTFSDAAMVAVGNHFGKWIAVKLSPVLESSSKGSSGAIWEFDPRNIGGMELKQLAMIGVADDSGELMLAGSLLKGKELNWAAAKDAVMDLFDAKVPEAVAQMELEEEAVEAVAAIAEEPSVPVVAISDERRTLDELTADPSIWPEEYRDLISVFEAGEVFEPYDAPGWIFVKAPVPTDSGISYVGVGVDTTRRPLSLFAYAVPGTYAPEPPPGLEGYEWRQGANGGYWVVYLASEDAEEPSPVTQVMARGDEEFTREIGHDGEEFPRETPWEECDCGEELEAI